MSESTSTQDAARRTLVQAIEARATAIARELAAAGAEDPDEVAAAALRQAVDEHTEQLAAHPPVAALYAGELRYLGAADED